MKTYTFNELRKIYEQGVNLDKISRLEEGLLFLKIRSLTKNKLKELGIAKKIIEEKQSITEWKLREILFDNSTNEELTLFILDNKDEIAKIENVKELVDGLKEVKDHAPSVFLDSFDRVIKGIVRDKTISSLTVLKEKIKSSLTPKLNAYVEWSWFNQNANDLIEDIFRKHDKIIPTLRKVHGVDFFIKLNKKEIPVDLKVTFLPKEFVLDYIKEKKTTNEVIAIVKKEPKILAEWLYKNQNPRLFNNNIRLFIVLIDKQNLIDSWKLKAEYGLIKKNVNKFLDVLSEKDTILVEYEYTKEDRVAGNYDTSCFLLIIEK